MTKKRVQYLIFALLLLGGLTYAYYENILSNQLEKVSEISKTKEQSQSELNKIREIHKNRKAVLNGISGKEEELELLNKSIPDSGDAYNFGFEIYNTLKKWGFSKGIPHPKDTVNSGEYFSQSFELEISGERTKLLNFIKYLQKHQRKIKIKQASIKVKNAQDLDVILVIEVFYMKS